MYTFSKCTPLGSKYTRSVLDQFMLVRIRIRMGVRACMRARARVCVCVCVRERERERESVRIGWSTSWQGRGFDVTKRGDQGRRSHWTRRPREGDRAYHVVLSLPPIIWYNSLPSTRCGPILTHALSLSLFLPLQSYIYLLSSLCFLASSRCSPIPIILFALSLHPPLYSLPRFFFFLTILLNKHGICFSIF